METFLFCAFSMLSPLIAQNEKTDTLSIRSASAESIGHESKIPKKTSVLLDEQDPETLIQSVSTVSSDRLLHRPVFQMGQMLDGTLPGLYVNLATGYPTESPGLQMRQRNLLIVVDGVPRSDANLSPNQIESVNLLKDGLGLAAWGMSSGDGILFIKTKRGAVDKIKIDFTAQYAQAEQIYRPEMLDAYTYADLLNRAVWHDASPGNVSYDGSTPVYSADDLQKYKTGSHPYTHPNNDWYSILMRNRAPVQQYNLNLSGGSEMARYFIDLNMLDQEGFLKQDKSMNAYNTSESFKKWSMRANVDVQLTKNTLLAVGLFGQMFRENTPGVGMQSDIYPLIHMTPANAYPIFNPLADVDMNGKPRQTYGGNITYLNLYAMSLATGYILYPKTDLNFDISLEHQFSDALKGLYIKGLYSYNSSYREMRTNIKGFDIFEYSWTDENIPPDDLSNFKKVLTAASPSRSSGYLRQNRLQYLELHAGYDFSAGLNNSKTKLTYWNNQFVVLGTTLPMYKQGFNLHSTYDYNKKYLAEISFSANSLNYLKKGYQWGLFPAAGLGWNIARENFFNISAINTLKLRTTAGLNGNDGTGSYFRNGSGSLSSYYYTYIPTYSSGGSVVLGQNGTYYGTLVEDGLPYISQWEKSLRLVVGIDMEAFDKSLKLGAEYFNNYHFDILGVNSIKNNNGLPGITPAAENFASYRQQGFELDLTYQKQFGDFSLVLNPLITVYRSITLENGEPEYPEPYMSYKGKSRHQIHGYIADGFFQSQAEIDDYLAKYTMYGFIAPKPGDIRYKDLNGDFIIDDRDQNEIYSNAPRIEYGLYFNAGWKGLSFSMQWAGLANVESIIINTPFQHISNTYSTAYKENLDYWTPENPNASYPRLSAESSPNNTKISTFWVKNVSYLRLKNVELSYSLPQRWMKAIHLSGAKIFVNAYNALTFTPLKYRDPEIPGYGSTVPNFKAYNIGLNVQL
jgi:TonB-linked SusC/RagA family outer membrane protein